MQDLKRTSKSKKYSLYSQPPTYGSGFLLDYYPSLSGRPSKIGQGAELSCVGLSECAGWYVHRKGVMIRNYRDGLNSLSPNDYLIAGSASGLVSRAIVQPLDVLKIRFQLQVEPISISTGGKYRGFIQAIRCINKEEGVIAFWKGHIPAQLQAISFSALQFLSFEVFMSWIFKLEILAKSSDDSHSITRPPTTFETFICGCFAGSVSAGITQPLDVLRTRFIAQGEPKLYRSLSHAALYIASHEGVSGYFRGLVPTLLLITPQTGLQFAIYHTCNRLITQAENYLTMNNSEAYSLTQGTDKTDEPESGTVGLYHIGPMKSLISGGLAGMGAKCVVYPLDVVKKRMQVHGFEEARVRFGRVPTAGGLRNILISIWSKEGASALFKGLRPTMLKSCVSISCRFTVYEQICRFLYGLRNSDKSVRTF